jgi:predicted RNase H-like HicB family nuclease
MINVLEASMTHSKEDGYVGKVAFEVANHKQPYEIMLYRKKGKEWGYSLNFLKEPGGEEEIEALEELLEENDEIFDQLIEAAQSKLPTEA